MKGDRERGKAVFKEHCSSCHRLEGVGQQIGADLAAIRDRGLDAVLLNILDPNREVMPQYQSYVLVTTERPRHHRHDRRGNRQQPHDPQARRRRRDPCCGSRSRSSRSTGLSFMPEGLEKQIDVAAMADLLAFISSAKSP